MAAKWSLNSDRGNTWFHDWPCKFHNLQVHLGVHEHLKGYGLLRAFAAAVSTKGGAMLLVDSGVNSPQQASKQGMTVGPTLITRRRICVYIYGSKIGGTDSGGGDDFQLSFFFCLCFVALDPRSPLHAWNHCSFFLDSISCVETADPMHHLFLRCRLNTC